MFNINIAYAYVGTRGDPWAGEKKESSRDKSRCGTRKLKITRPFPLLRQQGPMKVSVNIEGVLFPKTRKRKKAKCYHSNLNRM